MSRDACDTMAATSRTRREPDEQTREYAETGTSDGTPQPRRVRIVLLAIAVLVVVSALVVWGLTR